MQICVHAKRLISQRRLFICTRSDHHSIVCLHLISQIIIYPPLYKTNFLKFLKKFLNFATIYKVQDQNNFSSFLHNFCLEIKFLQTIVISQAFWQQTLNLFTTVVLPNNVETCELSNCIFSKH